MNNKWHLTSIIWLVCFLISGCSTVKVPINVTHPAEINMSKYKQIAISTIDGNMSRIFIDDLKSRIIDSGRFTLVDRNRLDEIMHELRLSNSDLAQSDKAAKLGNLLPATAIITGRIDGDYKEKTESSNATCYKDKVKYSCTNYTRSGKFNTSGSMDVIDVSTGEIVKSKRLANSCENNTSATDETPPSIDRDELVGNCLNQGLNAFFKAISPWSELVNVPFRKDGDIPNLEFGINKAKIGDMDGAIATFQKAIKDSEMNPNVKPKVIANAYWDLGLALQYSDKFDRAAEAFKKSYILEPSDECMSELKHCEVLRSEKRKLDDQMK